MIRVKHDVNEVIIGVPSKGHLRVPTISFLTECGFKLKLKTQRRFQAEICGYPNYKVVLSHPMDIPVLLNDGIIDVGFTGLDIIREEQIKLRPVVRTGYGRAKMCLMVPKNKEFNHLLHLQNKIIATPFPNIAQDYFDKLKIKIELYPVHGTSEGMSYLGFADGIVDIVETGISAEENDLRIVAEDLFYSECVAVVGKPELYCNYLAVNNFLRKIYR